MVAGESCRRELCVLQPPLLAGRQGTHTHTHHIHRRSPASTTACSCSGRWCARAVCTNTGQMKRINTLASLGLGEAGVRVKHTPHTPRTAQKYLCMQTENDCGDHPKVSRLLEGVQLQAEVRGCWTAGSFQISRDSWWLQEPRLVPRDGGGVGPLWSWTVLARPWVPGSAPGWAAGILRRDHAPFRGGEGRVRDALSV